VRHGSSADEQVHATVGPVIGSVTSNAAKVLLEVDRACEVCCSLGNGIDCTLQLQANRPTIFDFAELSPGTRYHLSISGCFVQVSGSSFKTPPVDAQSAEVKFGILSCNKIYHTKKMLKERKGDLWKQIAAFVGEGGELDCLIHIGDQVYADEATALQEDDCKYQHALGLLEGRPAAEWKKHRNAIKELYRDVYRETWGHPPTAEALANVANIMIMNDHEIRDGYGEDEEELAPTSAAGFIARCGYDVYCEYQRSLRCLPEGHMGTDHFLDLWGGSIGIALIDIRAARAFDAKAADPTPYLGSKQWSDLRTSLSEHGLFAGVRALLVLAATPLVFYSPETDVTDKDTDTENGLHGQWSSNKFRPEQVAMLDALREWKNGDAGGASRELVLAGGGVHVGACTAIFYKGEKMCEQLIASPVSNKPSSKALELARGARGATAGGGGTAAAGGGAPLSVLTGDYSFSHRDWEERRNFGIITVSPSQAATSTAAAAAAAAATVAAATAGGSAVRFGGSSLAIELVAVDPTNTGGGCCCVMS
jgi:hypothetical protein